MARNVNNSTYGQTANASVILDKYEFEIKNPKWWNNDTYATFNLCFPELGMTVYGMTLRYGADKAPFISFPKRKDKDGKYWNHVYINLSPEMTNSIIKAVENT